MNIKTANHKPSGLLLLLLLLLLSVVVVVGFWWAQFLSHLSLITAIHYWINATGIHLYVDTMTSWSSCQTVIGFGWTRMAENVLEMAHLMQFHSSEPIKTLELRHMNGPITTLQQHLRVGFPYFHVRAIKSVRWKWVVNSFRRAHNQIWNQE